MAIGDAYATAAEYKAEVDKTIAADDPAVSRDLLAVSRWIDREVSGGPGAQRFFTKDAAGVARDFRPVSGLDYLAIDDLSAAPSLVQVDDSDAGTPNITITSGDYELWPLNAPKQPEPQPYTRIYIPAWSAREPWVRGRVVRITGQWGWPAVPGAIKDATIWLTAILRLETSRAQSTVTELGQVFGASMQARGIVEKLMQAYSRKPLLV
jgi:hypothetical protein